jgi:acyl carrier protein
MAITADEGFKLELKRMIVEETGKSEVDPAQISDDEPLFGPDAPLELDSLDGLQVSVALKQRYGVEVNDSKLLRRIMRDIDTLADYLQANA